MYRRHMLTALYRGGVFLMAQADEDDANSSQLIVAARDSSLPPLGTATGNSTGEGLRETVAALDFTIPGELQQIRFALFGFPFFFV